jgi:ketosteroid isomerase-like protein
MLFCSKALCTRVRPSFGLDWFGEMAVVPTALMLTIAASDACSSPARTGGSMFSEANLEADRRAIEALNDHDVKAALANNVEAIVSQWTDDFVVIPAAGPIVRGRSANAALAEQGKEQMLALVPVDYRVEMEEITVTGDYAFEWGTYRGAARPRAGGSEVTYSGKLLRILQRQPDGSWKMHRTMTTIDPPARR